MSRRLRHQWVGSSGQLRRRRTQRPPSGSFPLHRRLHFEPLEDRRLLSITVNTLVDEQDGSIVDGDVSLRDAIAVAASGETIGFSVTGTINLTGIGDLVINKNLTINGPGASLLTIRAFNPSAAVGDGRRVFNIDDNNVATFKNVFISGLTLSGGDLSTSGGAIRNASENLTISACTISGNASTSGGGGGIANFSGNLTVTFSTISGNTALAAGGGIYNAGGSFNLAQSTVSGNSNFGPGGGIFGSSTTMTIDSSTVSGNSTANSGGGGISHGSSGTGILMTITNSTISGNSAEESGGGVLVVYSNAIIRHSTITANLADAPGNSPGNGGGLFVSATLSNVTIDHTIVARNLRQTSTRDDIFGAVVASSAFNLIGVNTGLTGISHGTNGNQIGTAGAPISPFLSSLANNGGPTMTHALLGGSPAIDTGDPAAVAGVGTVPLNDQRGAATFGRIADGNAIVGARIDIGAYEQQTPLTANLVVDTLNDENDGTFSAGDFSLREALGFASPSTGPITIAFAAALTSGGPATILLTLGEIAIAGPVTITGPGASLLTINGTNNARIFNTSSAPAGTAIVLQGLTLTNGDSFNLDRGGAIFAGDEMLTLQSCAITNSSAFGGGAIDVGTGGSLLIEDSTLSGNSADGSDGGAIHVGANVLLTIRRSTLSGNTAANGGGAIDVGTGGSLLIEDSTLSGNSADGTGDDGGAIDLDGNNPVTIRRSTLSGNTAADSGGAIYFFSGGSLTVEDSTLSGNIANSPTGMDGGGAVYFFGTPSNFLISNSTLSGNSAPTGSGGAICLRTFSGTAVVQNSTVTGNSAGVNGGGIARTGGTGVVSLSNTIVAGNTNANTPDLSFDAASNVAGNNNLIGVAGVGNFTLTGTGNQSGTVAVPLDAELDDLANNGGPTMTRALLTGSPAIDAGDPAAVAGVGNVPQFDQRGAPFTRKFNSTGIGTARIDIGAFELQVQPLTPAFFGDYNQNGTVDAGDYVLWRKTLGTTGITAYSGADGDGDTTIDQDDHGVWRAHFGQTVPLLGMGSEASIVTPSAEPVTLTAGVSSDETSLSLPPSEPNEVVERRGASVVLLAPRSTPAASPRAAIRSSLGATAAAAVHRRDDALLVWLAQPESKQKVKDWQETNARESEEASSLTELRFDSVDQVFAMLASS